VITSGRWNVCFTDNSGPTWSRLSNLTTRSFAVSALGSFDFPVLGSSWESRTACVRKAQLLRRVSPPRVGMPHAVPFSHSSGSGAPLPRRPRISVDHEAASLPGSLVPSHAR
jgi:hypothetical protein